MVLKKKYAFGIDEKLFTPESDRDRVKNRFNNFMKKLDMEIKMTDKYFEEKKKYEDSLNFNTPQNLSLTQPLIPMLSRENLT